MILVDTNVFIDSFDPSAAFHHWASHLIRDGLLTSGIACNPIIIAELAVGDRTPDTVTTRLEALGVVTLDLPVAVSIRCAKAYSAYLENRRKQGAPIASKTPLPDFFIGAHASFLALPVATADLSRYQTYFPEVKLLTPYR